MIYLFLIIIREALYILFYSIGKLVAQSVLAAAGFAAQHKANITMDGRTYPLSLFLITVAESGDHKTACDRVASKPLDEWQRRKVVEHTTELRVYRNAAEYTKRSGRQH